MGKNFNLLLRKGKCCITARIAKQECIVFCFFAISEICCYANKFGNFVEPKLPCSNVQEKSPEECLEFVFLAWLGGGT